MSHKPRILLHHGLWYCAVRIQDCRGNLIMPFLFGCGFNPRHAYEEWEKVAGRRTC
jgi:hypothetical protein